MTAQSSRPSMSNSPINKPGMRPTGRKFDILALDFLPTPISHWTSKPGSWLPRGEEWIQVSRDPPLRYYITWKRRLYLLLIWLLWQPEVASSMCFCSSRENKLNGTRKSVCKTLKLSWMLGFSWLRTKRGKKEGDQNTLQGRSMGISHLAPPRRQWCDIPLCPQCSQNHVRMVVSRACWAEILPGNLGCSGGHVIFNPGPHW